MAGGVESMSRVPLGSDGGAWMRDPATSHDTWFIPQGVSADLIATIGGRNRHASTSTPCGPRSAPRRLVGGLFDRSVVPVRDCNGMPVLEHDEFMRPGTTVESLAALKPSFEAIGDAGGFDAVALQNTTGSSGSTTSTTPATPPASSTAPPSSPSAREVGERYGLTPRARIVAAAVSGSEPTIMLTGPAPASRKLLAKAGLTVDDIDLFEINEAFAAVLLKFAADLGVSIDKVNVNGGAIAMGHPLGATGAMILGTLIDELERRDHRYGLVTLCIGGGMGVATWSNASDRPPPTAEPRSLLTMSRDHHHPLGPGRRRRRHPRPGRPRPVREHHERGVPRVPRRHRGPPGRRETGSAA